MALLPVGRANRRAVHRVGPQRSDRQADGHDPAPRRGAGRHRLPRHRHASAPRRRRRHAGRRAPPLRPRPLRVRHRQLADPAGRDPAAHHHPARGGRCRPAGAERDRRAGAGAQPRARLPAQRGLLRGDASGWTRGPAPRPPAPSICTSTIDKGPSYPLGPDHVHRQPRPAVPRRSIRSSGTPPGTSPGFARCRSRRSSCASTSRRSRSATASSATSACASPPTSRCRRASTASRRTSASRSTSTSARRSPSRSRATAGMSSSTLRDELTLLSRGSYDDFEVGSSADAIQRYYQADGYFFARVDWRRERLSADEERVVFTIDEGPQLRVRGIEFAGNKSLPAGELAERRVGAQVPAARPRRRRLRDRQADGAGRRAHRRALPRARGSSRRRRTPRRRRRRRRSGRLGAVAAGADTVSREARTIFVRYTIEEGPRLVLGSEDFRTDEGRAPPLRQAVPARERHHRPGDPYTPQAVRDDGRRLERLLGDAGYPGGQRRPRRQPQRRRVSLTWVLKLGRARPRRPDLRARQLQDHARDHPGADPARSPAAT